MRFRFSLFIVAALLAQSAPNAQAQLVSKWEKVGPVNFTALVHQSPTRIVATTDHGYLYITNDDGTTWRRQEISDTLDLEVISFGDSLHGMALSEGTFMPYSEYRLVVTTDGGQRWNIKPPPVFGVARVACIGADTAFLVDEIGDIFRSTDGGSTWTETYVVDTAHGIWQGPAKIKFVDSRTGYALGQGGWLTQTSDAGAHWTARKIGDSTTNLLDIDFFDRQTGVIGATGAYLVTSDGGANWAVHKMPHDETWNDFTTVGCFTDTSFFAFGDINGLLYTSNDLGATIRPSAFWEADYIHAMVRATSGGWLAIGSSGTVLYGVLPLENATFPVWTVLAECPSGGAVSLHATNGALLQSVAGSYPLVSMDSGFLWHITDRHDPSYGAIHFPSPDTGYFYYTGSNPQVYGGVNLRTLDSGRSWKQVDMSGYIHGTTFGTSDTGFGFQGSLVRTIDGGVHWLKDSIACSTNCPYPGYNIYRISLMNIASPDGLDAFVTARVSDTLIVQQPGKPFNYGAKIHFAVYKTSDGGASWTSLNNIPTLQTIRNVYFRNASLGFLLCDNGKIFRTSDGGSTWTLEKLAADAHAFNSINFLNDRLGFLTLDSAAVLATTDAGLTWSWLLVPTNREEIFPAANGFTANGQTMGWTGMNTNAIFFSDSSTILVSFVRTLINAPPPPGYMQGLLIQDGGLYRAKLNLPHASIVEQRAESKANALALSIYPNPARDAIHISVTRSSSTSMRIDLLDILGRTVYSCAETNPDFTLDVASLPDGVYTIRCSAGGETATTPFTITR